MDFSIIILFWDDISRTLRMAHDHVKLRTDLGIIVLFRYDVLSAFGMVHDQIELRVEFGIIILVGNYDFARLWRRRE